VAHIDIANRLSPGPSGRGFSLAGARLASVELVRDCVGSEQSLFSNAVPVDELGPEIAGGSKYLIGGYGSSAIQEVDPPALFSCNDNFDARIWVLVDRPMLRGSSHLSAKVQRSASFSGLLLQIAKLFQTEPLTLLGRQLIENPIVQLPSCNSRIKGAVF
jgi:hypothetical protein